MVRFAWAIFLLFPLACTSMTGSNPVPNYSLDMQLKPMSNAHWLNQARFSTLATLPWNQKNGIAGGIAPDAMGMGFQTEAPAKVWGPILLRRRNSGGVFAISSKEIVALNEAGEVAGRYNLPATVVLDLVDHQEALFVLHNNAEGGVQLTCLEAGGNEKWSREQNADSKHLLKVRGAVYLAQQPKNQGVSLLRIDAESGKTSNVLPTDSKTTPVFAGQEGEICFLSYDPTANQRLWNRQLLGESASPVAEPIPSDMHGLFAFPAASDAHSNAYGIFGMEAGKVAMDKSGNWKLKLEALVPGQAGSFWVSESKGDQVQLMRTAAGKVESAAISVPQDLVEGERSVQWRLVRVDQDAFYLSGLNPATFKRMRLRCDRKTGTVANTNPGKEPGVFGSTLQGGKNWAFNANGDLILPVATPDALVLVKVEM